MCNVANTIYGQRVQDTIHRSWIMHSKQVPISDDDYAPEHLIKPLTPWYPSNQDNCAPLSCFSTMTRPAMLEKGQLWKLQSHCCQQQSDKWERHHMLKWLQRECLKTGSHYSGPERLMFPLMEMHTHTTTSGMLKWKQSLSAPLCILTHFSLCITRVKCPYSVFRELQREMPLILINIYAFPKFYIQLNEIK